MSEASNQQMQQYCNERIRVRAEQLRALVAAFRDDKAAIDDVYARAAGANPWVDSRTDGPPKLLASQDILVYNAFASLFLQCIDGTAVTGDVQNLHSNLAVFQAACVRPVSG